MIDFSYDQKVQSNASWPSCRHCSLVVNGQPITIFVIKPHLKNHQERLLPRTPIAPLSTVRSRPPVLKSIMASTRPLHALVRARPASAAQFLASITRTNTPATSLYAPIASFSTAHRLQATPSGPPPAGFRLPPPKRWDQASDSTLDTAGKYFLLTEMMRGMYVVLEQFFRPPYVYPTRLGRPSALRCDISDELVI